MSVLQMLLGGEVDLENGLLPPLGDTAESGFAVALSGDPATVPLTAVVSAPGYLDGAVHIYHWNGTAYGFHSTIISPAPSIDFGWSVALNDTATVLAVGAPDDQGEGRIHMYTWNGTNYVADEILAFGGLGPSTGGRAGESVVLSKLGTSLLASAPLAAPNDIGWAYSWVDLAGTWTFINQRIGEGGVAQSNGNGSDSISMSADGLTAVISQPGGQYLRIFERASISTVFSEVFTLQIAAGGGPQSVGIDDVASIVLVPGNDGVRSYWNDMGTWTPKSFVPLPPTADSSFGSVIVARNNEFFVGESSGNRVHEFTYDNTDPGAGDMTFVQSLFSPNTPELGWKYGFSLSLMYPTGTRNLAVGEPARDRLGVDQAGNAYVLVSSWP